MGKAAYGELETWPGQNTYTWAPLWVACTRCDLSWYWTAWDSLGIQFGYVCGEATWSSTCVVINVLQNFISPFFFLVHILCHLHTCTEYTSWW